MKPITINEQVRIFLLCTLAAVSAVAQVDVSGTVADRVENEPLAGASVIVKGADGKIKKFATSGADGGFAMTLPSVMGCRLDVTMMGFVRQSLPLDSVSFPLTVRLEQGTTLLKEVVVKADRIREQGDTISYNVGSFVQAQDRSIGDVLKRMPGIDVAKTAKSSIRVRTSTNSTSRARTSSEENTALPPTA